VIAADHEFGSQATELKLSVVEAYLHAFTTELRGKFSELWYIDAFAGTGARSAYLRAAEVSSARGRQKALSDDEDQQRSLSTSSQRLTDSYSSKSANVPSTRYEKCEINTLAGTSMSSRATLTTKSASIGKQRAMPPRSRNYTPQDNAVFSLTRHHYGEQRTSEHYKITLGQDSKQSSRRCCHRCPTNRQKAADVLALLCDFEPRWPCNRVGDADRKSHPQDRHVIPETVPVTTPGYFLICSTPLLKKESRTDRAAESFDLVHPLRKHWPGMRAALTADDDPIDCC
jgi:hypothetical protein